MLPVPTPLCGLICTHGLTCSRLLRVYRATKSRVTGTLSSSMSTDSSKVGPVGTSHRLWYLTLST